MALFKKRAAPESDEWYYCVKHKTVEQGLQCPSRNRLGPYASREEAEHAMDRVRERNEEWDAGDEPA